MNWKIRRCDVKTANVKIHIRCSRLPEYTLVRLMNTQNSYSCNKYVRSKQMQEDRYEEDMLKVRELIAKEESTIEQLNMEANFSVINADVAAVVNDVVGQENNTENVEGNSSTPTPTTG